MRIGIEKAVEFTLRQLENASLDEDARESVVVATLEAIGNAVRHTPTDGPEPEFRLSIDIHKDYVLVNVVDYGPGFELEPKPMPSPLEEEGRGIPLMQSLCDAVTYEQRLDGNHLMLYKRLRPELVATP